MSPKAALSPKEQLDRAIKLSKSDSAVQKLLRYVAAFGVPSSIVSVKDLEKIMAEKGVRIWYYDLVRALKGMDSLQLGQFISGRRGHETRFRASEMLPSVAKMATVDAPVTTTEPVGAAGPPTPILHRFVLRHEFEVELRLPGNLTTIEAARLGDWLRTLPFAAQNAA